jgi:hypothetical protein
VSRAVPQKIARDTFKKELMNRRNFIKASAIATVVVAETGCPSLEQWFQVAAGLLPIVLQTVEGLETGNGGLSAAEEVVIQNFGKSATAILNDVTTDIGLVKNNTGIIPTISALLSSLQKQAQQILPQFTTNAKVTGWINAILADAIDLFSLVPIVTFGSSNVRAVVVTMSVSIPSLKNLQQIFQHRLQVAQSL